MQISKFPVFHETTWNIYFPWDGRLMTDVDCAYFFHFLLIGAGSLHEVWDGSFEATLTLNSGHLKAAFYFFVSTTMNGFLYFIILLSSTWTEDERYFLSLTVPARFQYFCQNVHLLMSGNSLTCIKLHLFTTDWTWTYECSPVLWYHSTSLSVNLLWNSNCKGFGKSTYVFKRNIDVFSV